MSLHWILNGLISGFLLFIITKLTDKLFQILFPRVQREYCNTHIFRELKDPRMTYFLIHPFIFSLIVSFIKSNILNSTSISAFTFLISSFFVSPLLGIFMDFGCLKISFQMASTWWINTLIAHFVVGLTIDYLSNL
eukprot:TRINITY_DN269_c0_g2_i1.p1 TRINITY_DN269_c0_g2~~TRINITY_DN269_c0_g2_i1.p1  ORF type:complete len:136 (-),score=27.22 TRINITY_DN269_c0_g2_i1:133-540(-)